MREEIIIAGFGGEGVVFAGEVLAWAAMLEGKFVSLVPSYGPETRGGTVNARIMISDVEIDSPFIENPTALLAMNRPSLERFEGSVRSGGLIVLNRSLIERDPARDDLVCIGLKAKDIAVELGIPNAVNIVMCGAYISRTAVLSIESAMKALEIILVAKKGKLSLVEINQRALKAGANAVAKLKNPTS